MKKALMSILIGGVIMGLLMSGISCTSKAEKEKAEYKESITAILQRSEALDADIKDTVDGQQTWDEAKEEADYLQQKDRELKSDLEAINVPSQLKENYSDILNAFSLRADFLTYYKQDLSHGLAYDLAMIMYEHGNLEYLDKAGEWLLLRWDDMDKGNSAWNSYRSAILRAADELDITIYIPLIEIK